MSKTKKGWNVAVLPGDGIGPEVVDAALEVLDAVMGRFDLDITTKFGDAGLHCVPKYGTNLPKQAVALLESSDCVIKGPMTTPEGAESLISVAVQIRKEFELYANVRPCKVLPNVKAIRPGIDLVVVRENSEGMYSGLDFNISKDTAVGIRVITTRASERIGRFALDLARKRKKHLTIVHKGNILKASDGLFKETIMSLQKEYKDVKMDDAHVDAMAQWLIKKPELYDVMVMENLFGDILSEEAAIVVGDVGVVPSANIGKDFAMFEPVHGSAPKYAGKDKVNPISTILSVRMMLEWMGYDKAAKAIQASVERSLKNRVTTYDLGGRSKCSEVGSYIARQISKI